MCRLTVLNFSVFVCLTLIVLFEQGTSAFNLDTDFPIVKESGAAYDTYFGFSVSAFRLRDADDTV